jgi:hypothetical protein
MSRSLQELAQEALSVQDACNLSGVVHAMSRVMSDLWDHARQAGQGTDWVNRHPITQVFIDKLVQLSQYQDTSAMALYHEVLNLRGTP